MEQQDFESQRRKSGRISKPKSWNDDIVDDEVFDDLMRTFDEEENSEYEGKYHYICCFYLRSYYT